LIVTFGEIIPQAICSRHGLAVGARTVWIVKIFVVFTFILSYPISILLDRLLGREIGTIYNRHQMKSLIEVYNKSSESEIHGDDKTLIKGALDFSTKQVGQIMTKMEDVFMLEIDTPLSFSVISRIYKIGHSRIPVYEGTRDKIVGLLLSKELVILDPDDNIPIRAILQLLSNKQMPKVFPDTKLDVMLNIFQTGRSHLALVHDVNNDGPGDPYYFNIGILTLEDVLEELIMEEILDETDMGSEFRERKQRDESPVLLFVQSLRKRTPVPSTPVIVAAAGFLSTKFRDAFGPQHFSMNSIKAMLSMCEVVSLPASSTPVIDRGEHSDVCLLLLEGEMEATIGIEEIVAKLGSWEVVGVPALQREDYVSDLKVVAKTNCRALRITRQLYNEHGQKQEQLLFS